MATTVTAPFGSFVQFEEMTTEHCTYGTVKTNLPVLQEDDVAFMFVVTVDTEAEADALSAPGNTSVALKLTETDGATVLLTFGEQPERFRISDTQVLYYWTHGFPGFASVVSVGECFKAAVSVNGTLFPTNTFERINEYNACYTSVLEYGSDDNGFGFNYCASAPTDDDEGSSGGGGGGGGGTPTTPPTCVPTRITFNDESTFAIPYTAALQDAYGLLPTVQVWLYENGELVKSNIQVKLDAFPPTELRFDFGGNATGLIIIK